MAPKGTLLSFQSHRTFDTKYDTLANDSLYIGLQVFNPIEKIFDIGQLLGLKKTAKVNFALKPITLQILLFWKSAEMVT